MLTTYRELLDLPVVHYYYYGNKDNCKVIDVTEKYPAFINPLRAEIETFKQHEFQQEIELD